MSQRAVAFFEQWVARNRSSIDRSNAARHVSDLLIDAAAAGIPSTEFDEEFPVMDHHLRVAIDDRAQQQDC